MLAIGQLVFSEVSNQKKWRRLWKRTIDVNCRHTVPRKKKFSKIKTTSEYDDDHRLVFSEVSNQRTWKASSSVVHKEGDGRRDLHAYTLEVDSKEDRGKCLEWWGYKEREG